MKYLLDTCVVSEVCKKAPNEQVLKWLEANSSNLYISVISIEELKFGEFMLPKGKRRNALKSIIDGILEVYSANTLSFNGDAALICAEYHEKAITVGRTPTIEDLMIASIAQVNGMAIATRNLRDFEYLPVKVINPFK